MYTLKIITILVALIFFVDSVCYSITSSEERALRPQLLTQKSAMGTKDNILRRILVVSLLFALFVRNSAEIPFLGLEIFERSSYLHREIFVGGHPIYPRNEKTDSYLEFNLRNYLAQFVQLKNECEYNKILNITNWLNDMNYNFSWGGLPIKEIKRVLTFLEDPMPIKSNSISARWLISICKSTVLSLVIPQIYSSYNYTDIEAKLIIKSLQNLSAYQEKIDATDMLFLQYFPSINPQVILSERIQQEAKVSLSQLESKSLWPQYSKAFDVVSDLFSTFGTLEDMEKDIRNIHYLETIDTIEIPIWQLESIVALRKLDPTIKKYIVESSKRHNLPERLILAHLMSVWKRSYAPVTGIDIAKDRSRISEGQAKWLKRMVKIMDFITDRNTYHQDMDPDVMAFIGGVVLDAHSTTGLGRLRPAWPKRDGGFDLLGEDTKKMSTRKIALKLWDPEYNIEGIARHWEVLAQEGKDAVSNAMLGKPFDTSHYSNETETRRFTRNDRDRIDFYKLCPPPEIFELKGEEWMTSAYHPVELELQHRRMGTNPKVYSYGMLLPLQILISRSGLFGHVEQKARITEIKTVENIIQIGKLLATQDSFIREACLKALSEWSSSKENIEMKDKAMELLKKEKGTDDHSESTEGSSLSIDGDIVSSINTELDVPEEQKLVAKYLLMVKYNILGAGQNLLKNITVILQHSGDVESSMDLREDPNRAFAYDAFEYIIENSEPPKGEDYIKKTVLELLSDSIVGGRDKYHIIDLIGTSNSYRRSPLTFPWIRQMLVEASGCPGIDKGMRDEIYTYIRLGDEEFKNQRDKGMLDIDRGVRDGVFLVNNGV